MGKADVAFQKIKDCLCLLSPPDFSNPFTLTDASDTACGAVLMHETNSGKKDMLCEDIVSGQTISNLSFHP